MIHGAVRTYDFPNAWIYRMADGSYREQPKWCLCISVARSREYVVEALCQLRKFKERK